MDVQDAGTKSREPFPCPGLKEARKDVVTGSEEGSWMEKAA